ncbi:MAG: PucR family transcriptional regulator [Leucobacter sp.]|nr:PucR family transcriptional regulator [Leucobacter sp.]
MADPVVIELDALLRDYLLGLVLIAGAGGSDSVHRPVQWVHSSDLADPSPFLTPRTVLLTTGRQFGDSLEELDADLYVTQLLKVGTTALGVSVGVQWDRIPPQLIAACERQQLPLFRVPYDTPFIAVVRTAARLLEAESHSAEARRHEQLGFSSMFDRRRNLAAAEHGLRRAVLQLLLAGHRSLADEIAVPLFGRLPKGQVVAVSLYEPQHPKAAAELTQLVTSRPDIFSAHTDSKLTIIAEPSSMSEVRRVLTTHGLAAGISERASINDIAALVEQAERAAELSRLSHTGDPLAYRPEMHAGVLQLLQGSLEAARRAQGLLAPLRRHDAKHDDDLEQSLMAWLAHHGQTSAAAAELGVHRHTLRARVATAAQLLQRDLDNPDTRAELWAAFRLTG